MSTRKRGRPRKKKQSYIRLEPQPRCVDCNQWISKTKPHTCSGSRVGNKHTARCEQCGSFLSRTKAHECTGYSDVEIIQLALINPGYGFVGFCMNLSKSTGMQDRALELFQRHKEETGLCLFSRLQDPEHMIKVGIGAYYAQEGKHTRLPKGTGRYGQMGGKKGRRGHARKIKLAPEFNWGGLGEKKRRYNSTSE